MLIEDLERLGRKVLIASKVNSSRFEEEHSPLVIIGDIDLVRRDALERSEVIVTLEYLFEFSLNNRKVVF